MEENLYVLQFTLLNYELQYSIDEDEFYVFKNGEWMLKKFNDNGSGYLFTTFCFSRKTPRQILKHRLVYYAYNPDFDILRKTMKDNVIDHIDGNISNNSIENLRLVTQRENCYNRKNCKGYSFNKGADKWQAQIKYNGRQHHLGLFCTEEDAHHAYLEAKKIHHIIAF